MPQKILITGASSGLGHAYLKHYATHPNTTIHALDQTALPSSPETLISKHHASSTKIHFHNADITSASGLSGVAGEIVSRDQEQDGDDTKGSGKIDLLIHSAGIRGLVPSEVKAKKGNVAAAETWEVMNHETMMKTLEVNTWGAFNVIKTFLPLLKKGSEGGEGAKVIIMSSRMGSVEANTAGGGYAYRASKAALNAVMKSFSLDVKGVTFLLLHPGRVETRLVEWKEEGAMSAEESLETCLRVIEGCTKEDTGKFVDRFGEVIRW